MSWSQHIQPSGCTVHLLNQQGIERTQHCAKGSSYDICSTDKAQLRTLILLRSKSHQLGDEEGAVISIRVILTYLTLIGT